MTIFLIDWGSSSHVLGIDMNLEAPTRNNILSYWMTSTIVWTGLFEMELAQSIRYTDTLREAYPLSSVITQCDCFNDIVSMINDLLSSDLGWYSFFWADWNPMVAHGGHILIWLLRKNVLKVTFSNIQFIQSTCSVNIPLLIGETYHFVVKHVVKLHQNTTKPLDFSSRKWPTQL